MKKHILLLLFMGLFTIFISSCKKYLDKAPISTFTPDEVFANFANLHLYFDAVYKGQPTNSNSAYDDENMQTSYTLYINGGPRKFSIDQITDQTVGGRIREDQPIRLGNMGSNLYIFYDDYQQRPQLTTAFKIIRKCNTVLNNIDGIKDAPTQNDIYDLKAQAFFVRAYAHYMFFRFWGPMPYIDHVIGPYDQWDIPRLSKYETCKRIADDFDTAYVYFQKAGIMRRDNPVLGGSGHLSSPDQFRPAGATCKALKSRILLYAASPLNNAHGVSDWQDAAIASWDALQSADANGYFMLDAANYKTNWVGQDYSDEAIWAYSYRLSGYNTGLDKDNQILGYMYPGYYADNTSWCADNPTQATVDAFETAWGDPLNTQADRDAATALGHYNEQDPYANRDPRFYVDILYNQANVPIFGPCNIWWKNVGGVITYSNVQARKYPGITYTGVFARKWFGNQGNLNPIAPYYCDPIIRYRELLLNYAEAANEAYGPNTPAPGAAITAVQAINQVRSKIGQPNVLAAYTGSTAAFRPRIKNERNVELCFEDQYFMDERRWMDAPVNMGTVNMGVDIEQLAAGYDPLVYPTGYRYTRLPVVADHQTAWKDAMYYFPFYQSDYFKLSNFDMSINPYW